jgi:excisionase family DNA binding protein
MARQQIERADEVESFVQHAEAAVEDGASIRLAVQGVTLDVHGGAARAVLDVLAGAGSSGAEVLPPVVTTGQAARLLGVSRPTVVNLIERGVLDATRIGSHRRLRTADVLLYAHRAASARDAALDDLTAMSQELGLYER